MAVPVYLAWLNPQKNFNPALVRDFLCFAIDRKK